MRPGDEAQPFFDKAEFEKIKARPGGIAKWIEDQLAGTSVTVVLFGAETFERPWVRYELKRSYELGKGILAIDIHSIRDPQHGADVPGANPLDHINVRHNGMAVPMSRIYSSFDWVRDNGYANMPTWIESAARAAGR